MNSQRFESAPLETDRPQRRRRLWAWLAIGLLAYAGYVMLCFYMESEARTHFKVPSKADIAAITDKVTLIRAQSARNNALAEMQSWKPYVIYSTGVGIVVFGGSAILTILGAIVIWRGVRRDSVRKAGYIVVGVLLVMLFSMILFAWPALVAERRIEATQTSFLSGD